MRRRIASGQDLHHFLYEIEMFCATLLLLPRLKQGPVHNAVLESFATHTRNLHEFFCETSDSGGYMKPRHFVSSWNKKFPIDSRLMGRVASEIAHLGYDRKAVGEHRSWDTRQVANQIIPPARDFLQTVEPIPRFMEFAENKRRTTEALAVMSEILTAA
jgi:hypothetical protein